MQYNNSNPYFFVFFSLSLFVLGHELPFVIKMNYLQETGRSIQQDDNSYKFILIDKNNSTRHNQNATNLTGSITTTNTTSTSAPNNSSNKSSISQHQTILHKEFQNLKLKPQQIAHNANGKSRFDSFFVLFFLIQ